MKIFDKVEGWETKVNFVDNHNVMLGYDMGQQCCEQADWFIASRPATQLPRRFRKNNVKAPETPNLSGWRFDTKYFKELTFGTYGDDHVAIFRIVRGKRKKYIHIFNCHNGYYGHGFEFKVDAEVVKEGCL